MTGYQSKRAAARDKLDDDDTLTIAYQSGYYDGKKAAQPAQEPVAWCSQCGHKCPLPAQEPVATLFGTLPVYDNTPPQRPWVGLTYEEIGEIHSAAEGQSVGVATGLTERKLKEKNS